MRLRELPNRKLALPYKGGVCKLRVWWTKPRSKKAGYWKVRCGCCSAGPVIIYPDDGDGLVEINGVIGHLEQWIALMKGK